MKKDSVFVRSFKDGKFYMILRKDIKELDTEMDPKAEVSLKPVMNAAWNFQCSGTVPSSWRTEVKYESSSSEENEEEEEEVQEKGGTSEEEEEEVEPFPEERDNFLQQLYKFMEDRGTPINKRPVLGYRKLNLFKLYRLVHKLGGFNSIESGSVWKQVYQDLGIPVLNSAAGYNVKCAYRKYLYGFEDYCTSTGITFHIDLPFKATESSHTDSSIEGPAERTNHVYPRPNPEISLSMKKIVKEGKSEEAEPFRNKVNSRSPKDKDMVYSDEDSSTDKELKVKVEESLPAEDSCTENVKVEPCKDQNRDLLRDDSSQDWEEGEEFECYPPGMKVQVRYGRGRNQKTYEATVKESDLEGGEVLYLVHYCGWNVRYDEWIKADKIIRPANKNVPKIKHRKKIKNKIEQEVDRIGSLNDREDHSPIDIQNNQSSSLGSGNGVFSKMEEFKDASGQKSPVKSFKIISNVSELQVYLLMLQCQAFIIREVLVKDSVTFPCSCTGNCPVVQWSRFIPSYTIVSEWKCPRGQNLQKRFEISGDTSRGDFSLMIISVAYNDGGSYRCSCNGETVSEVKMKVLVATVVKVQEKQNVTLPCYGDTRRQDVKDVQWKKDGGKVVLYTHANRSVTTDEAGSRFMMSVEDFLDGDLSLHISSVHLSDAGIYRCLLHDESQDGEPSTVVLQVEANSSDSEDQCLSEMAAKALMSKCSTQDTKAIIPPKGSARTTLSHKYHKHPDSEHLYPKEQQSSRGSRTYKWSFQMSDLEKMTSLEKIAFLQEKLQDIRNHYLLLKSEVASIDRRRKRIKKKERENELRKRMYCGSRRAMAAIPVTGCAFPKKRLLFSPSLLLPTLPAMWRMSEEAAQEGLRCDGGHPRAYLDHSPSSTLWKNKFYRWPSVLTSDH
ncbi:AT-rich interactive domain-containing protein 4B isoform X2 [Silurus asotus]|uniref:AT-rich interactive domain-containing protein 4B isoform X2 n=1 Tax=Silurus asotus TaxID=30991 RepID=A0AAD5A4V0_SILAS|nr:AT-rich interactive domain-containing protein 4B isoform X2 [Silurus asotus]